ncbi:MAG TPA: hypothetical protein VFL47_16005, partial [Flavisolibacter sp.]|nr:hypothetical protein [Flavisolibacter sp.]
PKTTAMQKLFLPKAILLLTLLFGSVAVASFAAFRETKAVSTSVKDTCSNLKPAKNTEMLWEVISRQFLSAISL